MADSCTNICTINRYFSHLSKCLKHTKAFQHTLKGLSTLAPQGGRDSNQLLENLTLLAKLSL
jgi:hypothetical protein